MHILKKYEATKPKVESSEFRREERISRSEEWGLGV